MRAIFQTRLTHWKKQWLSLLFWFTLPVIATLISLSIANAVQEDSKVPIGIVMEENTPMANSLLESIESSPLIQVYEMSESEVKKAIESHELDSAFIIEEGYERKLQRGNRNKLITSYISDLSFAYIPVSEMITSYVQEDTGKVKAAHEIINLANNLESKVTIEFGEIIAKAKEVQEEESLLFTSFTFKDSTNKGTENNHTFWNPWGLWALFSILSTLLLSDWVIKEKRSGILPRFAFIRFSFKNYLVRNLIVYTAISFLFDMIAILIFHWFLDEQVSLILIGAVIGYRIMINTGSFLLALLFKNMYLFYSVSFALLLFLVIMSGVILPLDGLINRFPWISLINPLEPFLNQEIWNPWLIIIVAVLFIWIAKGEKFNA